MTDPKQALQQKYMELQVVGKHLDRMKEQLQSTDERIAEVSFVIDSLQQFEDAKEGDEVLLPVTNGVFAKAILQNNAKLMVNVGSDVVVEKSIPDTVEMLDKQRKKLEEYRARIAGVVGQLHDKSEEIKKGLGSIQV